MAALQELQDLVMKALAIDAAVTRLGDKPEELVQHLGGEDFEEKWVKELDLATVRCEQVLKVPDPNAAAIAATNPAGISTPKPTTIPANQMTVA